MTLRVEIHHADALTLIGELDELDAVVTDPPYGIGFMRKRWDKFTPESLGEFHRTWLAAALDRLRPGGHLIAFASPRTYHHLAFAAEAVGFEVRDTLHWLYSSSFPKSLDAAKAADAATGQPGKSLRQVNPGRRRRAPAQAAPRDSERKVYRPGSAMGERWQGWGTTLKPCHELALLARKPFRGTLGGNLVAGGLGALNIDASRVPIADGDSWDVPAWDGRAVNPARVAAANGSETTTRAPDGRRSRPHAGGRWPPNVLVDPAAAAEIDRQSEQSGARSEHHGDAGGAGRFFPIFRYVRKPSPRERGGHGHPTVKPVELMAWLLGLVVPPGGTVLDPFAGIGSTAVAACYQAASPHGGPGRIIAIEREGRWARAALERVTQEAGLLASVDFIEHGPAEAQEERAPE